MASACAGKVRHRPQWITPMIERTIKGHVRQSQFAIRLSLFMLRNVAAQQASYRSTASSLPSTCRAHEFPSLPALSSQFHLTSVPTTNQALSLSHSVSANTKSHPRVAFLFAVLFRSPLTHSTGRPSSSANRAGRVWWGGRVPGSGRARCQSGAARRPAPAA